MDFDQVLIDAGGWGRFQRFQGLLLCLAPVTAAMHALVSIFQAALPDYTCLTSPLPIVENNKVLSNIEPQITDIHCMVYDINYTEFLSLGASNNTNEVIWVENSTRTLPCKEWNFDKELYGRSIVSRWSLVCDNAWLRSLASSIFMLGLLCGCSGLGYLSDRIGRKPPLLASLVLLAISDTAAAFVPSYWAHVICRFLAGAGTGGAMTCSFVLLLEIHTGPWRLRCTVMHQIGFALGYMVMSALANFIRDYSFLLLATSLTTAIIAIMHCFVLESGRWLLSQNQKKECENVVRRIALINHRAFPSDVFEQESKNLVGQKESSQAPVKHTFFDLLRTPNMRKKSLMQFYIWFVISFVYYGLQLGDTGLVGSPYLNTIIFGVVEISASLTSLALLNRVGRCWPLAVMTGSGGVCCLSLAIIPEGNIITWVILSTLGKFGISGSFGIIYMFSGELSPTVLRTTGVGAGATHARIGGLFAPFIAHMGHVLWKPFPFVIFGLSAVLGGGISLLLPETLHQKLPDTIQEGEHFGRETACCYSTKNANDSAECPASDDDSRI